MTNAEVVIQIPTSRFHRDNGIIDRALTTLKRKLNAEGIPEDLKGRRQFMTPRQREKFKRGRRTGPKKYRAFQALEAPVK